VGRGEGGEDEGPHCLIAVYHAGAGACVCLTAWCDLCMCAACVCVCVCGSVTAPQAVPAPAAQAGEGQGGRCLRRGLHRSRKAGRKDSVISSRGRMI
jgi:hypothetical protein